MRAVRPLLDGEAAVRRRLADALAAGVGGIGPDEPVGGCGITVPVPTALDRAGVRHAGTRGAARRGAPCAVPGHAPPARAGLSGVAVADVRGALAGPAGLGVEALLAPRDAYGTVDRSALRPGDRNCPATPGCRPTRRCFPRLRSRSAIDGATRVAGDVGEAGGTRTGSPPGDSGGRRPGRPPRGGGAAVHARGGAVLPDAVVNSVTGAGWWPAPCGLTGRVPARAVATTTTPRAAAHARAAERLPVIAERFGWCR